MIQNYLKIAWRNLVKRKFYSALNIFGLALGIACSLFLYLFISFHLSFDTYHEKASTTYRVVHELLLEETLPDKGASMGMYNALLSEVPQVTDAAAMLNNYSFTVTIEDNSKARTRFKENHNVALVSPEWFKLFRYNWVKGSPDGLKAPNTVALTVKQATKYFGKTDPMGKTIVFENTQPVKVVGLINNEPGNTDLKADMYLSLSSLKSLKPDLPDSFFTDWAWINSSTSVYLSLKDNKMERQVESLIAGMAKAHLGENAPYYRFRLQPLAEIHFDSRYGGAIQKPLLITLVIIGILILIIASINYVNISIAQQAKRNIEIGTRKVLGGTPGHLFTQFMVEAFLTVSMAMVLAACTVVLILPAANQILFAGEPLSLVSYKWVGIFSGALLIVLVVLAGFYPAFILSRINVFKALKNEAGKWKAGFLRRALVVIQNSVAQILIICTLIMVLQVRFLKSTDVGFNRDALVIIPLPEVSELKKDYLSKKLNALPQVESFSFCFSPPSSENNRGGSVNFDNRADWEAWPARSAIGDTSYVKAFGLQVVAGRNIRESRTENEFLINEQMIKKLGLQNAGDALGKSLVAGELDNKKGTIVGIVSDFNTKSLLHPIEPVLITSAPATYRQVGIKLKGVELHQTINDIRKSWEEVYPKQVFEYHFFDEQIAGLYKREDLQQKLIWIAASVAIIISCFGLLGLVSLITLQRTKEVGIRKVLGASVSSIVRLLSSDFLKLILISVIVAFPISRWAMNKWLEDFAFRIEIEWWMFVLAGLMAVIIAIVTVSFQAIKAAVANPVKSLRTE